MFPFNLLFSCAASYRVTLCPSTTNRLSVTPLPADAACLLVELQGQAVGIVEEADPLAVGGIDHDGIGGDAYSIQLCDGLLQIGSVEAQVPHTAAGGLAVVGFGILLAEDLDGGVGQLHFQLDVILGLTVLFLDDLEAQLVDVEILGLLIVGYDDGDVMNVLYDHIKISLFELLKNREDFKDSSPVDIYIIPMGTNIESLKLANQLRELNDFDALFSGSDQILNSFYTLQGERRYKPTSTYYLTFAGNKTRKIGYAVSFGCESYPEEAKQYMRVITGTARGKKLKTLESLDIRPTSDMVKEAIFSIIQFDYNHYYILYNQTYL